jgi:hypothetical protein
MAEHQLDRADVDAVGQEPAGALVTQIAIGVRVACLESVRSHGLRQCPGHVRGGRERRSCL